MDFHGSWGNPKVYWRASTGQEPGASLADILSRTPPASFLEVYGGASRYVRTHFPFWNASGGADHIWANTRDAGTCSNPWGSIWEETNNAIALQNWGGVTGLGGIPTERCFDARKDIVVPGVLSERVLKRSPFVQFYAAHPDDGAAAAEAAAGAAAVWDRKTTLLFFHGAICWQTYDHVDGLKRRLRPEVQAAGVTGCQAQRRLLHQSSTHHACPSTSARLHRPLLLFGVRYEVSAATTPSPLKLRATDVRPGPPRANLDDEVLASTQPDPERHGLGDARVPRRRPRLFTRADPAGREADAPAGCRASPRNSLRFHRSTAAHPRIRRCCRRFEGLRCSIGTPTRCGAVQLDQRSPVDPARAGGERHGAQGEAARAGAGDPLDALRVAVAPPAREALREHGGRALVGDGDAGDRCGGRTG